MTRNLQTLLLSLIMLLGASTTRAQWQPIAPLPEPNGGFAAGCVEGKIVIAGGTNWRDGIKRWLDKTWCYDPTTDHWSAGPALPHAVAYAACGSDGARLYLAGGADGKQALKEIWALDAKMTLSKVGLLPKLIAFPGGAVRDGILYVLGGTPDADDWSKASRDLIAVNLANGQTILLPEWSGLSHGLGIPAMAVLGSRLHAFTGAWLDPSDQQVKNLSEAFAYDAAKISWQATVPFPRAMRGVAAVALDDHRVYLAGGYGADEEGFLAQAWIYHQESNAYSQATALPLAICTTLVKCGDFIYALGGEDQKKHRTVQCFKISVHSLSAGK